MKYKVLSSNVTDRASTAVRSLEESVQVAINNGATLCGGVSVVHAPGLGFSASQAVLFHDGKDGSQS
jgi:hypothetical protein